MRYFLSLAFSRNIIWQIAIQVVALASLGFLAGTVNHAASPSPSLGKLILTLLLVVMIASGAVAYALLRYWNSVWANTLPALWLALNTVTTAAALILTPALQLNHGFASGVFCALTFVLYGVSLGQTLLRPGENAYYHRGIAAAFVCWLWVLCLPVLFVSAGVGSARAEFHNQWDAIQMTGLLKQLEADGVKVVSRKDTISEFIPVSVVP
ncbi:MAG: hypothetical protein AKCLJLPJ_01206 [Fimbriimonadales bacterium]|nr:hypothetical protein [Fimbriimonadales bacterium]